MFVLPTFSLGVVGTFAGVSYNIPNDTGSPGSANDFQQAEDDILALSPTNPSGEVYVYYGTDTSDLYVWDGSSWYIYNNDYTP